MASKQTGAGEGADDTSARVVRLTLLMLVLATGRERTLEHYEDLAASAGLTVDRRTALPTGSSAIVLRR